LSLAAANSGFSAEAMTEAEAATQHKKSLWMYMRSLLNADRNGLGDLHFDLSKTAAAAASDILEVGQSTPPVNLWHLQNQRGVDERARQGSE
ncbi:MAG: hypothetical protein VB876_13140, partial [Pirellulales bacterium]